MSDYKKHISPATNTSFLLFGINLNPNKLPLKSFRTIFILACLCIPAFFACTPETDHVNVYSSRHYQLDEDLFDSFEKETGIKVNLVKAGSDQLIKRLELEGRRSPADLLFTVDAGRLDQARDLGLLQAIKNPAFAENLPSHLSDPDEYWFPVTLRARIIAYHKDRVDPNQVSGYESLADPAFKNRVLMRSSENVYNQSLLAALILRNGTEEAENWAKGVVTNFARRPSGNDRDQITSIAAGDGDITMVNTYYLGLLKNAANTAERSVMENIHLHFPGTESGGTHVNVSGIALTNSAVNVENAKKLMAYLLRDEAQKAFMNHNFEYPARRDIETEGLLREWGAFDEDPSSLYEVAQLRNQAIRIFSSAGWR